MPSVIFGRLPRDLLIWERETVSLQAESYCLYDSTDFGTQFQAHHPRLYLQLHAQLEVLNRLLLSLISRVYSRGPSHHPSPM